MSPTLSVIMPCFNQAKYLVDSIEAILNQSYDDLELIITDDCSSDESREIIEYFRKIDKRVVAIFHSRNHGVSSARNTAIKASKGNYIAFCDADDIWENDKTKIQVEYIQSTSECDVLYCDSVIINEEGIPTGEKFSSLHGKEKDFRGNLFWELSLTNFINTPTVLLRKKCLEKVGLFDEGFRYNEDWLYWIALSKYYCFCYIDQPLVRYRVHQDSTNKDQSGYRAQRIEACKQIIDRFPGLPAEIKSILSYKMARDFAELGGKKKAFHQYVRSMRYDVTNYRALLWMLSLPFVSSCQSSTE